ncbi:MAG: histidinol-phosphate transaminase [Oscillospiraceae bacterium]|nr:histidinol-phosphate transaminase [Oscillospiraceae bacterium]
MAYTLCKKARDLIPYQPVAGNFPIRLDANESYFDLSNEESFPPEARLMCKEAMERVRKNLSQVAFNRYPDPLCAGVRQAFAGRFGLSPQQVTAGNGSDELIGLICGCLLEKGARLVTVEPDFSMYRFYGDIFELENRVWQKPADLAINPAALTAYAKAQKAEALIFSNPCNPTSLTLPRDQVRAIIEALPETLVVVDEAYMEFSSDESVLGLVGEYQNLIVLKTCSKALGLAGIRLGFAVADQAITRALQAVKSPYNVNSLTQAVGKAVLESGALCDFCAKAIIDSRAALQKGVAEVLAGKRQIEGVWPSQTNFIFLKTPAADEIDQALQRQGIAIRKMGGYLRLTAGSEQENKALLQALGKVVQ